MGKDILSQEEVDALLAGGAGDDDAPADAAGTVRPYDFTRQERVAQVRLPVLETIHERFARLLRGALAAFVRRAPDVTARSLEASKFADFAQHLARPVNLNIVQLKPLRGKALVVCDPKLVFQMIDALFGGDGRGAVGLDQREFTPTELRIIQRLLEVVLAEYRKSWSEFYPLEPEYVRSEIDPQFAGIAAPDEIVITAQFTIDFGGGAGELGICIPYAALDPVRGLIARAGQPDAAGTDALHASALARQLQLADVEVVATLAHAAITCQQLLEMRAGDVITIDRQEVITAAADGVPLFDCRYGVVNGRYALKVERLAAPHGDAHA